MYAYFGASFRLLKSPMGPCTSYFVTLSRMFTVMSFNDRRRPKHTRSWGRPAQQSSAARLLLERLPRTSQTTVAFCRTLVVAHCCPIPMTCGSCSCREHIKKLGDRSFSAASPRLWNDLPPGLRRPGLTFDSFRQSLKTHLFGDRSAE